MRALALLAAVLVTAMLGSPPAVAAPLAASVDDFTFDSFDVEYRLGVDDEGRAELTTVETFVARFPEFDQNRGIRRSLPAQYQGRTTALEVVSVTDENGIGRPYSVEEDSGVVDVIAAVPEGRYVRGLQTYVITYTQRDVVDAFDDTGAEEFYWNLTGTDWAQPFAQVRGRVVLEDGLADALIPGALACYRGDAGSTETCPIEREGEVVSVQADGLLPYQTATIALGFEPGTFRLFDRSYLASPAAWVQLVALLALLAIAVRSLVLRATRYRDATGRPVLVAEYLPPKGVTLLEGAGLVRRQSRAVASQLIDLAVRRAITVIEVDARFSLRSQWRLRLESAAGLADRESQLLAAFFGPALAPGSERTLKNSDTTVGSRIAALVATIGSDARSRGWRTTIPPRHSAGLPALGLAAVITAFVTGILVSDEGRGGALPGVLIAVAIGLLIVTGVCLWRSPLTASGAELRDHIRGLEQYIELAEADRMRVLQSPEGALRDRVDVQDRDEALRLTERLLPWAVLLGHEKQWAELLGRFYDEQHQPSWYSGRSAFSAAAFSSGISTVSSRVSSSYSGTSSSGGSSGGGSSGGGGGGGGGGGV
ncbi:DUF2207 domain-containing protein [Yonghaparkia sp. Soil809]|uniref:DUF2207 domain-containing protein n=1 Tax=Yonghaparkia sp. Soil809 TaxID=1736417 RepID=UPI0006FC09AE|nr:DUF2207 domain-containing protein [Yonghaparkia sp. Soil809]KRF31078.1 hypothetical protein ASG83_09665 [Yonghaparkia sp. Soil809]